VNILGLLLLRISVKGREEVAEHKHANMLLRQVLVFGVGGWGLGFRLGTIKDKAAVGER
jgi:hypothetical protein